MDYLDDLYQAIKYRCENKDSEHFRLYGGRGIKCEFSNLEEFRNYILKNLGNRPSLNHSIDRYPVINGNYGPGNLRWGTRIDQSLNRRKRIKSSSKFRGVSFNKKLNKWTASIWLKGKNNYIGLFSTEIEASNAFNEKYIEAHGFLPPESRPHSEQKSDLMQKKILNRLITLNKELEKIKAMASNCKLSDLVRKSIKTAKEIIDEIDSGTEQKARTGI